MSRSFAQEIWNPKMGTAGAYAHVSHFGVLKTGGAINIIEGNFPGSSINSTMWSDEAENSATVTVGQGVASMQCGTNSAGSCKVKSVRKGIFRAGQVTTFQSGVYAGTGIADNIRRWGVMDDDEQNGLFFELNGTTFRVVARAGGNDTAVAAASFNIDTGFTPGASNNTYRIFYSAGRAVFCAAAQGNLRPLHAMVDSNYPLVETLDLGIYYENTNSGNTTNKEMRIRGSSISVLGEMARHNDHGAQIVSDMGTEIAAGGFEDFAVVTKFGRSPDLDTGTVPEDLWSGGDEYTGFDATANQDIDIASGDADDQGDLISSGTATGGSRTTLVDSGADFVTTDGVAVGDLLINDTLGSHGVITAVTATQITVFAMVGGKNENILNSAGDTYRVANANDTGAAVVCISQILNADYEPQPNKYAILNGTSTVVVSVDAMRAPRAQVVLAGSSGGNEGIITATQATTHGNVHLTIPVGFNQTLVGVYTVPAGKVAILKRVRVSITRANGSPGSATITLRARRYGETFQSIRAFEVQTGGPVVFAAFGGERYGPGTDFKFRVDDVSDSNTIADGEMEFFVRDKP